MIGSNPSNGRRAKYYICFYEQYRCILTKYQFIKRFITSCNNFYSKNNKLSAEDEKCKKSNYLATNQLKSIFNQISFDIKLGIWQGFSYFFNLGLYENGRPLPYKISVNQGELQFFELPESNHGQGELVFVIKSEDLELDHNGDSIYPVSYFLNNFWHFYKNSRKYSDFALALQQIDFIRSYYPDNTDLDRFCLIIRVLG